MQEGGIMKDFTFSEASLQQVFMQINRLAGENE